VLILLIPCHRDLEAPQGPSNKVSDVKSCIRWEISQPFGSPTFLGIHIYIYIYIYLWIYWDLLQWDLMGLNGFQWDFIDPIQQKYYDVVTTCFQHFATPYSNPPKNGCCDTPARLCLFVKTWKSKSWLLWGVNLCNLCYPFDPFWEWQQKKTSCKLTYVENPPFVHHVPLKTLGFPHLLWFILAQLDIPCEHQ
jgi:hypothetical protein